jgi:DNA-binding IscR family transcriptional regulator
VWHQVSDAINNVLNTMTLADVIKNDGPAPTKQLVSIGVPA